MAININSNIPSIVAQKDLNSSQKTIDQANERNSSGKRVDHTADDAAELAITEHLNTQVRELNTAMRNAYDGAYAAKTADAGLEHISNNLQRMRELAVQATNASFSIADRRNLDSEFSSLNDDIARIAKETTYNDISLLDGTVDSIDFQTGSGTSANNTISLSLINVESVTAQEGSSDAAGIATLDEASSVISQIDSLFRSISSARSRFGAAQNQFDTSIDNLQSVVETQSAAYSRLIDSDYAKEAADRTRALLLNQASDAIAVQANVFPKSVLQLIV